MSSPFPTVRNEDGSGTIHIRHVPPLSSILERTAFQYPLKLISPTAALSKDENLVQTVYILTYGGGIVAGDVLHLTINLDSFTRLALLTQGSTKLFKSPSFELISRQITTCNIQQGAALCYLPDPVQPFEKSRFEQSQVYNIHCVAKHNPGSLCVLDWVSQGRTAGGENWDMSRYVSRNNIWLVNSDTSRRRVLRDNVILDPSACTTSSNANEMYGLGVFGTLMLFGPLFGGLQQFFMKEFELTPRLGGPKWDSDDEDSQSTAAELRRSARLQMEQRGQILWTTTVHRGCTVVKFGAREVEKAKTWLRWMLDQDGTVVNKFGERALLCLR